MNLSLSLSDRHKHTEGVGVGGMLTFLEYCVTRRCCYVDLRCGIQKGGGGMGRCYRSWHCVTRRCCYVEDVVTLMVLIH